MKPARHGRRSGRADATGEYPLNGRPVAVDSLVPTTAVDGGLRDQSPQRRRKALADRLA